MCAISSTVAHFGYVEPAWYGIRCQPFLSGALTTRATGDVAETNLRPGWYVISVHKLVSRDASFAPFRKLRPADRVGYSLIVFRVEQTTPSGDARTVRR